MVDVTRVMDHLENSARNHRGFQVHEAYCRRTGPLHDGRDALHAFGMPYRGDVLEARGVRDKKYRHQVDCRTHSTPMNRG